MHENENCHNSRPLVSVIPWLAENWAKGAVRCPPNWRGSMLVRNGRIPVLNPREGLDICRRLPYGRIEEYPENFCFAYDCFPPLLMQSRSRLEEDEPPLGRPYSRRDSLTNFSG